MNVSSKPLRLFSVELRFEQDLVMVRQRARQLAAALGFDTQRQTRITTALSEIARNAFQYAGGGRVEFSVLSEPYPAGTNRLRQTLFIEVRDKGSGIKALDAILAGSYRSTTGLGLGIIGSQRLMDRVEITTSSQGTNVVLAKMLPPTVPTRSAQQFQAIVDELMQRPPSGPLEEIQTQNQELLRAMEEARLRQEELTRVNHELAETNTGVLALYDELETLQRIGMMLASKLELRPLIQSIIDVTTTLTEADMGVFFFREAESDLWHLYATSGAKADALAELPSSTPFDFFGPDFSKLESVPDLELHPELCSSSKFAAALVGKFSVRSCLTVPVIESNQRVSGALLFASGIPHAFSERSERIITSIAMQAAIGIEKARLFQTVTAANDAKDQFFAMLSHELRTPLNPAMAIISSLQGDPRVPGELREELAVVWRNIRLEARLIDDLLDFNRLIKGKLQLTTDALDIHPLIKSVVEICREDLEANTHQLVEDLSAPRRTVIGDAARLQQVLWNVLKNAIKFTPPGGTITLRTSAFDLMIRIDIIDTGHGIEPGLIERIFSAFDQHHTHLGTHFGGLGLGLSIARMFVELHGGKISASSPGPGKGTTVSIELPLSEETVASSGTITPGTARLASSVTGRILLVDDHPDTLEGMNRLLKRRGFEVTAVTNGSEALAAARSATFDLFISDLGLPDCTGIELLGRVRGIQHLPAIALSGYGMESDLADTKKAGFQMHITKPVDFGQLMSTITDLLSKEE